MPLKLEFLIPSPESLNCLPFKKTEIYHIIRHVLLLASSEITAEHHKQFLQRHLLTNSVGCITDEEYADTWPSVSENKEQVIVTNVSSIPSLLVNHHSKNINLILILDGHCAIYNDFVIELIGFTKRCRPAPDLLCFTSCIFSDLSGQKTASECLQQMEAFYGCKLITVYDEMSLRRVFDSRNATLNTFQEQEPLNKYCMEALAEIKSAKELCSNFSFSFNDKAPKTFKSNCETHVCNVLSEIQLQFDILGESGGNLAALTAFRHLVRLYTFADSSPGQSTKHALGHFVCTLAKFRKILEEDMFRVQMSERVEYFSSKKVQLSINHLRSLLEGQKAMLVEIATQGKKLTHIKPELLINCSSISLSKSWEDILWWERNMHVYSRFSAGETNTIVLSGKLQELDLPCCDLVLVFDRIEEFSQFLWVKNQLKRQYGKLILFCENTERVDYENKIAQFHQIETELQSLILSKRGVGNQLEDISGFKTASGIEIKSNISKQLLYRQVSTCIMFKGNGYLIYCDSLPHDKFSSPWPVWDIEKGALSENMVCATLHLTCSSPVSFVKSVEMKTWEEAQTNCALQAISNLYHVKELDETQLTAWQNVNVNIEETRTREDINTLNEQAHFENHLGLGYLRGHLENSKLLEDDILCDISYPRCFSGNFPKVDGKTFIHKLKIWPISEPPPAGDNRKKVLYELLNDKSTFAILTSERLPQVCSFPIFMFGHELCVDFETTGTIALNQKELELLIRFHCGMFMKVLPIVQYFMQFNVYGGEIDWGVVQNNYFVPECREFTHDEKTRLTCTPKLYERTMVKPWYRYLSLDQVYLVTSVCMGMDADSCFPTDDFDTFTDYYKVKYNIILERPELPLLEAYLINTKVNGLLPRSRSHKLRREEKMEDFREHMLPELCMPLLFPAALWLKLSCLPTVLHRFSRLQLIEEFRRTIILEANVGFPEIKFGKLQIDPSCVRDGSNVSKIPPSTVKRGLAIGNVKLENRKKRSEAKKPWSGNQEPVDMYRNIPALNFVEIRYFDEYLVKSMADHSSQTEAMPPDNNSDYESDSDSSTWDNTDINLPVAVESSKAAYPESLNLLKGYHTEGCGPDLQELLEVFSSSYSNDGVNMDRIQVLGNAFLQFVVSVYAYQNVQDRSGSRTLTYLHRLLTDFMSKKNLVQISIKKELCNRIKVLDFAPGEWTPPCFTTPPMLKHVLKEQEISPDVLQQIELSEKEQLSGLIDPDTEEAILEILTKFVNRNTARRDEMYIDRHVVPQSAAANCVEALIGTYFKSCGWRGGLKMIIWLKLLPPFLDGLLEENVRPSDTSEIGKLPISLDSLEQKIDYCFAKKTLLVQAVSHESYINPEIPGNMDTLAFLGSSILDFIFSCYIYEHFKELDPSQLWRLREILCCTSSLAYLAVRHNIHKYLLSNSIALLDVIDRFIKHQKDCQQPIDDELQLLMEEHECETALQVEVPDALGKLLPAIIGAVYIDSGKNINVVWDTFKSIFLPELALWRQNVPLSVVDLLKDLSPAAHQVIFT
ncbi:Endoribonuclease Dcr-1 [Frankliniella fusca]|uniref:Endoribonuclease Dcr-1 n=1 Tax=Frankliniella fusca TaxID=407009 RepID=A0AAE1HSW4_9NEOP|nr:Endoribonuclease Dcr-1 [Frankliniella fusca]